MTEVSIPTIAKFKAGTVDLVSSLSEVVMFDTPFNTLPRVAAMPKQDMGNIRHWVEGVTVSQFTMRMSFTSTKSFDWIAMEF